MYRSTETLEHSVWSRTGNDAKQLKAITVQAPTTSNFPDPKDSLADVTYDADTEQCTITWIATREPREFIPGPEYERNLARQAQEDAEIPNLSAEEGKPPKIHEPWVPNTRIKPKRVNLHKLPPMKCSKCGYSKTPADFSEKERGKPCGKAVR